MCAQELSWREQLSQVRSHVNEAEKEREYRKKLEKERSREALSARLRQDTPQALLGRFRQLSEDCQRIARRLFPPRSLRAQLTTAAEMGELTRFYRDCVKEHGDLFNPEMRQVLARLLQELGELQRGLDRQLGQWTPIEEILEKIAWRAPAPADARRLLEISKIYNETAFNIVLSLPGDFYASESENFYVATLDGQAVGYVKRWPAEDAITFAATPVGKVNFRKLLRGLLWHFYNSEAMPSRRQFVRVRLGHPNEFKFFADMGFVRAETKSLTDSTYQWELD